MCNCIEDIEFGIRVSEQAEMAFLGHNRGQKSEFWYKKLTAKHELSKYNHYMLVPWKYCPWCGAKIT